MMNCFEARQEFPALWRKTATVERRSELTAHLATCAKCDHAFRVFSLTAPVLHSAGDATESGAVASRGREFLPADRPRRFAARAERVRPRWLAMSAAAAIFLLASSAAYISISAPGQSLTDALFAPDAAANSESAADVFAPEFPATENDLAS